MINEVYNIDCMEYMIKLPDKYFDLAIADPPYGINAPNMRMGETPGYPSTATRIKHGRFDKGAGVLKGRILNKMGCDWDITPPKVDFFIELMRVSKNQIIWGANYFLLPPTRGIIVWDKVQPWDNFSQVEIAWTSFDMPAKLYRKSTRGGSIQEMRRHKKIHPTQKPIELYEYLITEFSHNGDKIFDPMMGSQSSRIAAIRCGRNYYGCEIDEEYFATGCKRYKEEIYGK